MTEFAIGQSVPRREDARLLRGQGRFLDDLKLGDQLYATIVRSPYAHADIIAIDTRAATKTPGIHAWRAREPDYFTRPPLAIMGRLSVKPRFSRHS